MYLVRTADNSSSYPVVPQMLKDLTYPKTRSIFFSALVQHCWLCEHIFICHMDSRWRVVDGAFICGWQCILYLLGEGAQEALVKPSYFQA